VPVDGLGADDLGVADDGSLLFHTPPWRGSPAWAPEDLPRPDTAAQVEHLVAVVRSACPSNATAAVPAPDARRRPGRTWRRRRPAAAGAGRASDPGGPTAAVAAAPGLAGADRPPWHGLPAAPAEIPRRGSAGPSLVALRVVCMTLLVVLVVVLALGDRLTPTGAAAPRSATSAWPTAAGPSIAPAGSPVVTPHGPRRPASEPTRARSAVAPGVRPAASRPRDGVASRVGLQRPSAGRLGDRRGTRATVRGGAAERRAAEVEAGPRGRGRTARPVRPVRPRRFGPAGAPDRDGRPRPAGVARAARRSGGAVSPRARSRPGRRADGPRRDDHGGLLAGPGLGG
jgi:hypothetical protein